MKQNIFKIAVFSCLFFLASFESKATNYEFTWVNTTSCTVTVTVKDALNTVLYSSSSGTTSAVCLTNAFTVEITDNCGYTVIYDACGNFLSSSGTKCTNCVCSPLPCRSWVETLGSNCGPASPTICGPGSLLLTVSVN